MDKRWSAVFLLTLVLFVFGTLDSASALKPSIEPITDIGPIDWTDTIQLVKPGTCPPIIWDENIGLCRPRPNSCSSDSDCKGNLKCCFNGCGRQCMKPDIVKPGECPPQIIWDKNIGWCTKFCSYDGDCEGNQKCCSNGCGRRCMDPYIVKVKPGACPKLNWGTVGLCVESCSSDSDCEGNQKCCSNGCGHECMTPYIVKPGRCPRPWVKPTCGEFCSQDGECPEDQKCCRMFCGRTCTDIF